MESVSHAGCVIGILAPGPTQSESLKQVPIHSNHAALSGTEVGLLP